MQIIISSVLIMLNHKSYWSAFRGVSECSNSASLFSDCYMWIISSFETPSSFLLLTVWSSLKFASELRSLAHMHTLTRFKEDANTSPSKHLEPGTWAITHSPVLVAVTEPLTHFTHLGPPSSCTWETRLIPVAGAESPTCSNSWQHRPEASTLLF